MAEREPVGWLETVTLEGSDEPVKVVLEERQGNVVFLRQVDPCDPPPARTPMFEGDQLVVMTAISHIGVHSTPDAHVISDLITAMRVVPVRKEGTTIFARSLSLGEADDGRRIHVRPGDSITFEAGAIKAELDAIDAREQATESGHVPLSPVLAAWFHIGRENWDDSLVRYALAAARRLDMANELLIRAKEVERSINASPDMPGPDLRRSMFAMLGLIELAMISLGRALLMIRKLPKTFNLNVTIPEAVEAAYPAVNDIRNAYEHIEDRALGTVHGSPSEAALTIFDYERLLREDIISYGGHELDLAGQVPTVITEARAALKQMVGTAVPPAV
jgi:hypothetical protein